MTFTELKKLIEDEVSALEATQPIVANENEMNDPNVLREPQSYKPPRPVYRPVLRTEEEIDNMLFGRKPDDE